MGKPPSLLPQKDMSTKFEYARIRRASLPAAQRYGTLVVAMRRLGGVSAPADEQGLNKAINGKIGVNKRWLELLSEVLDFPTIGWRDWYEATDLDFYQKIDAVICHYPADVLRQLSEAMPDLSLDIVRESQRWRGMPLPKPWLENEAVDRAVELGRKPFRPRPIHDVAPGDSLVVRATLAWPAFLQVLNVDAPDTASPEAYVLTGFLNPGDKLIGPGDVELREPDGSPIPIGFNYLGRSRLVLIATSKPLDVAWRPMTDGAVTLAELRAAVIDLQKVPESERAVFSAEYRTLSSLP